MAIICVFPPVSKLFFFYFCSNFVFCNKIIFSIYSPKIEKKFGWKKLVDPSNLLFPQAYSFSNTKNISKRHSLFTNYRTKMSNFWYILKQTIWRLLCENDFLFKNKVNKNWCKNACHYPRTEFFLKIWSFFFEKMKKKLIFWQKNWQNRLFYHNSNEKL
jgi:hypothetical protein